ncbi:hypothetical protein A9Q74_09425 [Colwellia sp. 39_35_sub15_T18]|nr:hypothetical protein A9Q74_09425 [Colwellia sp. 39_35_sub15_T18]
MTTLHIVRQSAFTTSDFAQCLQTVKDSDCIVFTDDGCYNLTHPCIKQLSVQVELKAIIEHVNARAINLTNTKATTITMNELVALTFQTDRVITWQ